MSFFSSTIPPKHPSRQEVIDFISRVREVVAAEYHRRGIVISGSAEWCREVAMIAASDVNPEEVLWISGQAAVETGRLRFSQAKQVLGSELELVVYDGHEGFDADALGAVSGVVRGGGLFILLIPELDEWPARDDPEARRFMAESTAAGDSLFLLRLQRLIKKTPGIYLLAEQEALPAIEQPLPVEGELWSVPPYRTADQCHAVEAIVKTTHGHRKRPAVLVSDRGRGKSVALGIAAAHLLQDGAQHIVVTAPRLEAVRPLFDFAATLLPEASYAQNHLEYQGRSIVFMAPDELIQSTELQCDLLLVDEAAAIPTPMLEKLLDSYPRIAFATTVHGYEGTGRGFAVRFNQTLNKKTPQWRQVKLTTPIRWAANDPLEQFVFDALMLNANIAPDEAVKDVTAEQCSVECLDRKALVNDEALLSQVFGLLVLAHYRTRPNDLRQLLDSPGLRVYALKQGETVLGTLLLATEGGLDIELANEIYAGRRRFRGHLIPQSLAAHVGMPDAAALQYGRIMRIAIHPCIQRRGLGSMLVHDVIKSARIDGLDVVGASFGATPELLHFWQPLDFEAVRVGMTREHSSGTHSVMMLQALTGVGDDVVSEARRRFDQNLPSLLSDPLRDLSPEVASLLMVSDVENPHREIDAVGWHDLGTFADANLGYETVIASLHALVDRFFSGEFESASLSEQERQLLMLKVIQKLDWSQVCREAGFSGKGEALKSLRQTVGKLLAVV